MKNLLFLATIILFGWTTSFANCTVTVQVNETSLTISGINGTAINAKVFDENWSILWECNDWSTSCSPTETISNLSGNYHVSVQSTECDFYEFVSVTGNNNNTDEVDLTISNMLANDINAGEILYYTFDLNNVGTQTVSGDYYITSFISSDATQSADDYQDGEILTGNTGVGTINDVTGAITIPQLEDGSYYLLVCADTQNQIDESDESNNCASLSFTIGSTGPETCICDDVLDPVCADGVTYANSCEANCANVYNYEPGACEETGNDCGFKVVIPGLDNLSLPNNIEVTENGSEYIIGSNYAFNNSRNLEVRNKHTYTFDKSGNLLNTSYEDLEPQEPINLLNPHYSVSYDSDNGVINYQKEDGNVIWSGQIFPNDPTSIHSFSVFRQLELNDRVYFFGRLSRNQSSRIINFVTDSNGNLISHNTEGSDLNYSGYFVDLNLVDIDEDANRMIFIINDSYQHVLSSVDLLNYLVFDFDGNLIWNHSLNNDAEVERHFTTKFSPDQSKFVYHKKSGQDWNVIKCVDFENGNVLFDSTIESLLQVSDTNEQSFDTKAGYYPSTDGIIISLQYTATSGDQKFVFGKVGYDGQLIWNNSFADDATFYYPHFESNSGNILLAAFDNNTKNNIIVVTNSLGELADCAEINCDCLDDYTPVCVNNNETFNNACEANCAGVVDYIPENCGTYADDHCGFWKTHESLHFSGPINGHETSNEFVFESINPENGNTLAHHFDRDGNLVNSLAGNYEEPAEEEVNYTIDLITPNNQLVFHKLDGNDNVLWSYTYEYNPEYNITNWARANVSEFNSNIILFGSFIGSTDGEPDLHNLILTLDLEGNLMNEQLVHDATWEPGNQFVAHYKIESQNMMIFMLHDGGFRYWVAISGDGEFMWRHPYILDWHKVSEKGIKMSPDSTKLVWLYRENMFRELNIIDITTGEKTLSSYDRHKNNVSDMLNFEADSYLQNDREASFLPTNNGVILGFYHKSITPGNPEDFVFGEVDFRGNLKWNNSFEGNDQLFYPSLNTYNGDILWTKYNYVDAVFDLIKTDDIGNIIECNDPEPTACNITITNTDEGITIEGLVGENLNTNIFNEDWEPIWTCNPWNGSPCTASISVDLEAGYYHIGIQSSICDFYELVLIEDVVDNCTCDDNFDPVCDGTTTYTNACEAVCAGLADFQQGICGDEFSDCGFTVEHEGVTFRNVQVSENEAHYILQSTTTTPSEKQTATIGRDGSLVSVNNEPYEETPITTTDYTQTIDENFQTISFSKLGTNGNVTWTNEIAVPDAETVFSLSSVLQIDLSDRILFMGKIRRIGGSEVIYTFTVDLEGFVLSQNFEAGGLDSMFGGGGQFFAFKVVPEFERVIIRIEKNGDLQEYQGFDFLGNPVWNKSIQGTEIKHLASKVSTDNTKIIYRFSLTSRYHNRISAFDLVTGNNVFNDDYAGLLDVSTLQWNSGYQEDIQQFFSKGFYPTENGIILSFGYLEDSETGPQSKFIAGKINYEGELLWSNNFHESSSFFNPIFESYNGDILWFRSASTLIKTNSEGQLIDCNDPEPTECNITITNTDEGITIDGLVGENLNTNIFNEDWEPIWTCNPWTGTPCNGSASVSLTPGYYHIAIQSSLCDFYQLVQITESISGNNNLQKNSITTNNNTILIQNVFPNPAEDELFLSLSTNAEESITLKVIDLNGREVVNKTIITQEGTSSQMLDIQSLKPGLYQLILINDSKMVSKTRFVKI